MAEPGTVCLDAGPALLAWSGAQPVGGHDLARSESGCESVPGIPLEWGAHHAAAEPYPRLGTS